MQQYQIILFLKIQFIEVLNQIKFFYKIQQLGAFVNGETITGGTSNATAVIRSEDINSGSRLFISSQNDFIIGEIVTGGTSNATATITDYTANPVQNIQQLMEYADIDETIDQFFDQFKEAFLRTIPRDLTSGS